MKRLLLSRLALLAAIVAGCLLSAMPVAAAPGGATGIAAHTARSCGHVNGDYPEGEGGSGNVITFVRGVSCRKARRVLKLCISRFHVRGWYGHMASNPGGGLRTWLTSGSGKRITFRGTAGGGPHCLHDAYNRYFRN